MRIFLLLPLLISTTLLAGGWRKVTPKALDRYSASDVPVIVWIKDGEFVTVAYVIKEWDDRGNELPLKFREMGSGQPIPWANVPLWQPLPKAPKR